METLEQLIEKREELCFKLIEATGREQFNLAMQLDEIEVKIEQLQGDTNGEVEA